MIKTIPGYKIVDDNVSVMDLTLFDCDDEKSSEPGILVEAANFYAKNVVFAYGDKRRTNIYLTGESTRVSFINCDFSASANHGMEVGHFKGILSLTSSRFNNPVALEILSSPDCELRAVTTTFIGQLNYTCGSAEFNGCELLVGTWKKINIEPGCGTEFVSCTFDDETKTGWADASRGMAPVLGMRIGCGKKGITYKINSCVLTSGGRADKKVVLLSEGNDKEPGHIFLDGIEQDIDNMNWGKF
jgi:hypothetical protein